MGVSFIDRSQREIISIQWLCTAYNVTWTPVALSCEDKHQFAAVFHGETVGIAL